MNGASTGASTSETSTGSSSTSPTLRISSTRQLNDESGDASPLTDLSSAPSEVGDDDDVQLIQLTPLTAHSSPRKEVPLLEEEEAASTSVRERDTLSRHAPTPVAEAHYAGSKAAPQARPDLSAPGPSRPSSSKRSRSKFGTNSGETRHAKRRMQASLSSSSESELRYDGEGSSPTAQGRQRVVMVIDDDDDDDSDVAPTSKPKTKTPSKKVQRLANVETALEPASSRHPYTTPSSTPTTGGKRKASMLARELNSKLSWKVDLDLEKAIRNEAGPSKPRTKVAKRRSGGRGDGAHASPPDSMSSKLNSPKKPANRFVPDKGGECAASLAVSLREQPFISV